jgi:hypothetical protein
LAVRFKFRAVPNVFEVTKNGKERIAIGHAGNWLACDETQAVS